MAIEQDLIFFQAEVLRRMAIATVEQLCPYQKPAYFGQSIYTHEGIDDIAIKAHKIIDRLAKTMKQHRETALAHRDTLAKKSASTSRPPFASLPPTTHTTMSAEASTSTATAAPSNLQVAKDVVAQAIIAMGQIHGSLSVLVAQLEADVHQLDSKDHISQKLPAIETMLGRIHSVVNQVKNQVQA